MKNIFLIGFMGTGKSTVAAYLSQNYGMDIIEVDQLIEEREEMSIADIFSRYGESYFRDAETRVLLEIQDKDNTIVSCGGGVVLRQENVTAMKQSGQIVLLTADPQTILERVKDDDARPLLQGNKNVAYISELIEKRREKYEQAADIVVHTDDKVVSQICMEILKQIKMAGE